MLSGRWQTWGPQEGPQRGGWGGRSWGEALHKARRRGAFGASGVLSLGGHWRFPGGLLAPFRAVLESLIWNSEVGWDFLKRWNGQHSLNGNDFIQLELLL